DVEGDRHTHRSVRPHLVDLDGAVKRDHQRLAVKAHLVGRDGLLAEAPRRLALAALDDLKDGLFHCADSLSFYDTLIRFQVVVALTRGVQRRRRTIHLPRHPWHVGPLDAVAAVNVAMVGDEQPPLYERVAAVRQRLAAVVLL